MYRRDGCKDHAPPRGDIAPHGEFAEAFNAYRIKYDAGDARAPHHAEQHPSDRAAQCDERDGSVGPGYQQEYRCVIKYPHHALGARGGYGVIKAGHRKKQYHRRAVYGGAYRPPRLAVGAQYEQHRACYPQRRADSVRYRVHYLLAAGIERRAVHRGALFFCHRLSSDICSTISSGGSMSWHTGV